MKDFLKSLLVKTLGWPVPLFHGDTAVLDRWVWLRQRLPRAYGKKRLLDIGCGTGAFSIGAALRGYQVLGLSWDTRNQHVAAQRAKMCKAGLAKFEVRDVRELDKAPHLNGQFDVAMLFEVIEHILDDNKLIRDAAHCLKPGGRLLLTTPNIDLRPIDPIHEGPFSTVEDGGHVRKGYSEADLRRLCDQAGLAVDSISYTTGFLSQKVTAIHFHLTKVHHLLGWALIHPLRIFPPLVDPLLTRLLGWPAYSICLEAHKPEAA